MSPSLLEEESSIRMEFLKSLVQNSKRMSNFALLGIVFLPADRIISDSERNTGYYECIRLGV